MKKQYLTRLEAARELGINPNMLKHQISSRYKGKKPTLYLIRDVANLGHNNPQSLADEYYKPLFKSPDLTKEESYNY